MKNHFCILIPCYEKHALLLASTIKKYAHLNYDYIVINDGSSNEYKKLIIDACEKRTESIKMIHLENNCGKGGAVQAGLRQAYSCGYTHALQIDADGQHDHHAISNMITLATQSPHAIISGKPIYDSTVPRSRLYGRYITHFWTWVETLSFNIEDSMCGFRCYPTTETMAVLNKYSIGQRMDFDTDIMVRSYWEKIPTRFLPVKVYYPEEGASYFRTLEDNISITLMHTRLFFGMLARFPQIISFNRSQKELPWHKTPEKGSPLLLKFSLWSFFIFGETFIRLLAGFIAFYYTIFALQSVKESKKYNTLYCHFCDQQNIEASRFTPYQHIRSFANMIIDKLAVWKGRITRKQINSDDLATFYQSTKHPNGSLFISSHYGNIDIARALGSDNQQVKFNALMYTDNSRKITQLINDLNPKSAMNIIAVDQFDIQSGAKLKEKVDAGEHLFCMGDRLTLGSDKFIEAPLLGKNIKIPLGPFMLAYLLKTPTFAFHCYKDKRTDHYRISTVRIDPTIHKNRHDFMQSITKAYTQSLQKLMLDDPLQWYNFNSLW